VFFKRDGFKRFARDKKLLSWVSAEGQNEFVPPEIGSKNHKILEKLRSASRFRLIDFILATTLYLTVWHSHCTKASFAVLM